MKIYYRYKKLETSVRGRVAAVGVFDGLHTGHLKIIKELVKRAKKSGRKSLVITLDPHPLKILQHKVYPPRLVSLEHKLRLLEKYGVDSVLVFRFTRKIAGMKGRDFIKNILIKKIHVKEIIAGSTFRLGSDRFNPEKAAPLLKVGIIRPLKKYGMVVSSTAIRSLIIHGELKRASRLLARPVSVLGTVVKGARRGRLLGFPTANIDPHHEAIPPAGVYAVKVRIGGIARSRRSYKGILNIGFRPTFHGKPRPGAEPVIEVHIVGLKEKHIYGKPIEVDFVKRIREERHFRHAEALRRRIQKDLSITRKLLK